MNDRISHFDFQNYTAHFAKEVRAFVFIMNAVISLICRDSRGVGLNTGS